MIGKLKGRGDVREYGSILLSLYRFTGILMEFHCGVLKDLPQSSTVTVDYTGSEPGSPWCESGD
jgi:hypothetical protein